MDENQNNINLIHYGDLLLDAENPRLPSSVSRDPQSMLDYIAETTSIEELMDVIAKNDFFPGEPLVAVPQPLVNNKFIVVEGNRRLTAVKLLHDPRSCTKPSAKMLDIARDAIHRPTEIPVVVRNNRNEILPYLGYRHITGIKQWEPLAKARYIEQLFNSTNQDNSVKERYAEVAQSIGSRTDHIKRNLDALAVYNIINEENFYNIEGLNESSIKFAVLSTAIADERIGNFVGVTQRDENGDYLSQDAIINPSNLKKKEIFELTRWLFEKDSKGNTKIGESRNLRYLSAVVDNTRAIDAFRQGLLLKIAYQLTSDLRKDFIELLYQSEGILNEAATMVATVEYDENAFDTAHRILEQVRMIGRALKDKKEPDTDGF